MNLPLFLFFSREYLWLCLLSDGKIEIPGDPTQMRSSLCSANSGNVRLAVVSRSTNYFYHLFRFAEKKIDVQPWFLRSTPDFLFPQHSNAMAFHSAPGLGSGRSDGGARKVPEFFYIKRKPKCAWALKIPRCILGRPTSSSSACWCSSPTSSSSAYWSTGSTRCVCPNFQNEKQGLIQTFLVSPQTIDNKSILKRDVARFPMVTATPIPGYRNPKAESFFDAVATKRDKRFKKTVSLIQFFFARAPLLTTTAARTWWTPAMPPALTLRRVWRPRCSSRSRSLTLSSMNRSRKNNAVLNWFL